MSDPYLGEIQIFGFNFAPYRWATCLGQLVPIQQNTALFSLLGTTFGGDGRVTFQLPNYINRASCGQGTGPGLTPRDMGETFGVDQVSLNLSEIPSHTHAARIYNQPNKAYRTGIPAAGDALVTPGAVSILTPTTTANSAYPITTIGVAGGGSPHENRQPYLAMNFCIALAGVFPPRP
ncbi:TPA: phage tail protein [Stenotrophomonas maltophilia]